MKKLSNKQKLISGIAIILVVVIFAIIITTKVINNGLGSEKYSSNNSNMYSKLIANYIKKGITIGGITGTLETLDTSDATAVPEDIIWGKTGYVNGVKIVGTFDNSTLAQLKRSKRTVIENTIVEDRYHNQIKIPAGFKIAEDSPITIPEGVVIEDNIAGNEVTKGSQFVWIPIGAVYTDIDKTEKNKKTINFGRYTFNEDTGKAELIQPADNWNNTTDKYLINNCKELATSNLDNITAKNLGDFINKTIGTRGFYIGRYEAGDAKATEFERTVDSNKDNPVVCRKGVYPYSWVTQSQAANLARNMYDSDNFESDLLNSYVWDTAIVFVQTFSGDEDYSLQTSIQTEMKKCGEICGENGYDVRCSIYDMAVSGWEWTTETYTFNDYRPCVGRGGASANDDDGTITVKHRHYDTKTSSGGYHNFRPIIYL